MIEKTGKQDDTKITGVFRENSFCCTLAETENRDTMRIDRERRNPPDDCSVGDFEHLVTGEDAAAVCAVRVPSFFLFAGGRD